MISESIRSAGLPEGLWHSASHRTAKERAA